MNSELENINNQIKQSGVAERLLKNEDFLEYQKFLDEEINYYINKLVDATTHPKDYVGIRAEINARRGLVTRMKALIARKPKLVAKQKELEEIESA